jgi:radical SAM protein with 4Fe4S-binding SPASM domain
MKDTSGSGVRPPPARVYLDVTDACNLRCRHCCTASGIPRPDELTLGELERVIDQVVSMGVRYLVISGGEPMLRPDLPQVLAYARHRGLAVTLLTNGLLVDRSAAQMLSRMKIRVKISLDGATRKTHEALRGSGTFDSTLEALSILRSAEAEGLAVHFTLNRLNSAELLSLPAVLSSIGVRNLVVGVIKPSGRARENADLLVSPSMVPYLRLQVDTLARNPLISLQSFTDQGTGGFGCPATCNKFGVTASGRVTTCAFFGEKLLGDNVRDHALPVLWERQKLRDEVFVANERCAGCPDLAATGGGCRARAMYYHDDLNAPDPYCCAKRDHMLFLAGAFGASRAKNAITPRAGLASAFPGCSGGRKSRP